MKLKSTILILLLMINILPITHTTTTTNSWTRTCTVYIVAVSSNGEGVTGNFTVTIHYPGHGRVYISTSPASMIDTQGSARIAAFAASLLAGEDMTRLDFYYSIESDSIIIGGPSAGFAMALATLLALKGKKCTRTFAVTGMIQPDTSIGPVGGLKEKLEAAAKAGAKLFIVPAGQEVYRYYKTEYKRIGPLIITRRVPVQVNLTQYGEQLGVKVKTAATLNEGYLIVTGENLTVKTIVKPHIDPKIQALIKEFIAKANTTITSIGDEVKNTKIDLIKQLYTNASKLVKIAEQDYKNNAQYKAALDIVEALEKSYTAKYLQTALNNNLEITSIVKNINETLQKLYTEENSTNYTKLSINGIESLAKAWAKTEIAAYYYQNAINNLENDNNHYKLPSFLGHVDPTPAYLLGEAKALADWSNFWLNAAKLYPGKTSKERLMTVSLLLESQARTTIAYLDTLLAESGAPTRGEELPAFLTTEAITTKNPVGRLGISIEAIALSTAAIHEAFTLQPEKTSLELEQITLTLLNTSNSIQAELLLQYTLTTNQTTAKLLSISKATLYAYTAKLLQQKQENKNAPHQNNQNNTNPKTTKQTTSEQEKRITSKNKPKSETQPQYALITLLVTTITLIIGISIGIKITKT